MDAGDSRFLRGLSLFSSPEAFRADSGSSPVFFQFFRSKGFLESLSVFHCRLTGWLELVCVTKKKVRFHSVFEGFVNAIRCVLQCRLFAPTSHSHESNERCTISQKCFGSGRRQPHVHRICRAMLSLVSPDSTGLAPQENN